MRFIGNKELIASEISDLLEKKGLLYKNLTLLDAFCGTGSVSDALKGSFNIIANDILSWCVLYTRGRLCANDCNFGKLGFDPFDFFNANDDKIKGFFFKNFSPGGSKRMYFSPENAARIDYFRSKIEEWKDVDLISDVEYCYLLSCLIESVSDVSNTAGVYGAFLKHWDSRAKKPIEFSKVDTKNVEHRNIAFYNKKIENIISEIKCDILYIDPPYTQNQYGTQYHLLETLVLNDDPSISPITGSRSTAPMRSDWSKEYKAHILFDRILAKTKAKYILFSYNNDGLMSKSFIEASLKRYGKSETYVCKKIAYKKYRNFKTNGNKEHFEYLFFVEKKVTDEVKYESPLNYIGSKSKMIAEIKKNLPNGFDSFVDAFGGGFNVGVNIKANKIVYNDVNYFVKELVESFKVKDTYEYLLYIRNIIRKYGLEKSNSESYLKARKFYNSLPPKKRDPRLLYTIILYGYQQQIRFNGDHNFNNPVGMRWFNDKVLEKMISFSRIMKEINIIFKCCDYVDIKKEISKEGTFIYMDPPYRFTRGSYNDGKRGFMGWTEASEKKLCEFADKLNANGNRFMISYVLEHGGKINGQLKPWIKDRGYRLIHIETIPEIKRKELLIVNYKE
jgi:adenine-specific DNA-methyltransferase